AAARVDGHLVDRVLRHVAPPPPHGSGPREILHAVMAERRRRESERLQSQIRRRDQLFPREPR
ncbi:MAG: RDD family protein, partial [Mobilicoccus sp.]|nr:RDD family protein [Mobilicoccus sp.]